MVRISPFVSVVWVRSWDSRRAFQSSWMYPASRGRSFTRVAFGSGRKVTVTMSSGERLRESRIQDGMATVFSSQENSRTPMWVKVPVFGLKSRNVRGCGKSVCDGVEARSCSSALGGRRILSDASLERGVTLYCLVHSRGREG